MTGISAQSTVIDVIEFDGIETIIPAFTDPMTGECDANPGIFGLDGGAFVIRDREGGSCCGFNNQTGNNLTIGTIGPYIFTSNYCNVTVDIDIRINGILEEGTLACVEQFAGGDYLSIQMNIGDISETITYSGSTQTEFLNNPGTDIEIGDIIFLTITGGTQEIDEEYRIENITIRGFPKAIIPEAIEAQDVLCEGQDALILSTSPGNQTNTYEWRDPSNNLLSGNESTIVVATPVTPADQGIYTVTITEAGGCTSTDAIMIDIQTTEEKDIETRFPFVGNTYCESEMALDLPLSTADGRTGTWDVPNPLDLTGRSDSTQLVFTYNDNQQETVFLRIDTIPSVGNNLQSISLCITDEDATINLVDLFELNIDNIEQAFAFGSGYLPNELSEIDLSTITNDVIHTASFTSIPNGQCSGTNSGQVFINFERIDIGRDTAIQGCEGSNELDFVPIYNLISSSNPMGVWSDRSNSGVTLPLSPGGEASFFQLDPGVYLYDFTVNTTNICEEPINEVATLTVEVLAEVEVEIVTENITIQCGIASDSIELNFSDDNATFEVTVELEMDSGPITLGTTQLASGSHFFNIESGTANTISGNTITLDPEASQSYEVSITTIDLPGLATCGNGSIGPLTTNIEFSQSQLITVPTEVLCEGQVFTFREFEFAEAIDTQIIVAGMPCDSTFEIVLNFTPAITSSITVDPCTSDGTFRNIKINQDTMITFSSNTGECDTIWEILRVPTTLPDSIHPINELCDNDSRIIGGVLYDTSNVEGSFEIISPEGCIQTVVIEIDFESGIFSDLDTMICEGTTVTIVGADSTFVFDEDNLEGEVLLGLSSTGCDSIVFVSLEFIEAIEETIPVNLCPGETRMIRGIPVDENTLITETFVVGPNNCDSVLTFDVTVDTQPFTNITLDPCVDGNTFRGFTINQDTMITVPGGGGCDSILLITIGTGAPISETIPVSLCSGETRTIRGITVDETTLITQTFTTGSNGCDSILTFDVTVETSPVGNITLDPCVDGNTFRGIVVTQDTSIMIPVDGDACDSLFMITLLPSDISATFISENSCAGENSGKIQIIDITGQGPFTIDAGAAFSGSTPDNTLDILNLEQGLYEITIMDVNGCVFTNDIAVDNFNFSITIESNQNPDFSVNLNVTSNNTTNISAPIWSPAEGLSCDDCLSPIASPMDTTIYTVTALDENGCMATAMIQINGDAVIPPEPVDTDRTVMPNVFSPNSGNLNSVFFLDNLDDAGTYEMQIFNRYGEMVYEVNNAIPGDEAAGWTGTYNGTLLKPGVFVYRILHTDINNVQELISGDVLLLK